MTEKQNQMPEGFTIGMKVTSTRDGLTYEVTGPDPSPKYVKVRGEDGKVRARSTATLKVLPARKPRAKKTAK